MNGEECKGQRANRINDRKVKCGEPRRGQGEMLKPNNNNKNQTTTVDEVSTLTEVSEVLQHIQYRLA